MRVQIRSGRTRAAFGVLSLLALASCRGTTPVATTEKAAPAGPPTVEVVKVVEQPLNVTLSLPGELTADETVALYSRVNGFVKNINVDRGSRVKAGDQIAVLEAPELGAQKAEAQSKLQGAEAQLAAVRSKAEATSSTYDKLKAAGVPATIEWAPGFPHGFRLLIGTVDNTAQVVQFLRAAFDGSKPA